MKKSSCPLLMLVILVATSEVVWAMPRNLFGPIRQPCRTWLPPGLSCRPSTLPTHPLCSSRSRPHALTQVSSADFSHCPCLVSNLWIELSAVFFLCAQFQTCSWLALGVYIVDWIGSKERGALPIPSVSSRADGNPPTEVGKTAVEQSVSGHQGFGRKCVQFRGLWDSQVSEVGSRIVYMDL